MSTTEKAPQKAQTKKSNWIFLLIPGSLIPLVIILYLSFLLIDYAHGNMYAGQNFLVTSRGVGAIMAGVAPFFGAIPISLLLGNILIRLVPPARRALDSEAGRAPGTSFAESQKTLLKLVYIIVPIAYGLAFIGVLLPWHS